MPTIVDILTFMSRINFELSCVEHSVKISFITSGPDLNRMQNKEVTDVCYKHSILHKSRPLTALECSHLCVRSQSLLRMNTYA